MTHVQRFGLAAMVAAMAALGQASAYAQAPAEGDSGGETAFIRDPGVQAAFDAGVKMLGEKNYKGALAEFNKALNGTAEFKGDPTFPEAHIGMGEALKALEDFQGAAVAFSRDLSRSELGGRLQRPRRGVAEGRPTSTAPRTTSPVRWSWIRTTLSS